MQSDGLYRVGSENAKRRKTLEEYCVLRLNRQPGELFKFLAGARYPLFYEKPRHVFHRRGAFEPCYLIVSFLLAMLGSVGSHKIVLVMGCLTSSKVMTLWMVQERPRPRIKSVPIRLSNRNIVGTEITRVKNGSCSTLLVIPPFDCNFQLMNDADLIIFHDSFNEYSEIFIEMALSRARCCFVTREPCCSSWKDGGLNRYNELEHEFQKQNLKYNAWLRGVISRLELPTELLVLITQFAFGG
jgi:hypothetical protein